jgi:hypothetical protein
LRLSKVLVENIFESLLVQTEGTTRGHRMR